MPGDRPPTRYLQAALEAQRAARADELGDLLEQIRRIDAWLRGPLPDDLAAHLTTDRARLASAVADLLVHWLDAGGGIEFAGVELDEALGANEGAEPEPVDDEDGDEDEVTAESIPHLAGSDDADHALDGGPPDAAERTDGGRAAALEAPRPAPAPVVQRPLGPPARLASPTAVEALKQHIAAGGNFTAGLPPPDWQDRLAAIVDELADAQDSTDEIAGLARAIERSERWTVLRDEAQLAIVAWVAARLRALQDLNPEDETIVAAIRQLTQHQQRHRAGFVYGLARSHSPSAGTWEAEAARRWDALLEHLPAEDEPDIPSLARPTRSPAPSRARPEPAVEDDDRPDPIPADWPWSRWTRGKRAVMVGGDPREPNRVRLEAAFGFAELTWEQAEFSRNPLQKVRERVRSGRLDMVIVLSRFVGHDADQVIQPACKEYGVPFVPVPTGYGALAIRMAIERHLPGMETDGPGPG